MANRDNSNENTGTLDNLVSDRKFSKPVPEDHQLFGDLAFNTPKIFKKVDTLNDAGEQENTDEAFDAVEEDYWLNDESELSIEDFIATGEVVGDEDDDDNFMDDDEEDDSTITDDEAAALDDAGSGDEDDEALSAARLDSTDDEGLGLNEKDGLTGSDLDVPGAELDDDDEAIGEEDEENNSYSTSGQDDNNG